MNQPTFTQMANNAIQLLTHPKDESDVHKGVCLVVALAYQQPTHARQYTAFVDVIQKAFPLPAPGEGTWRINLPKVPGDAAHAYLEKVAFDGRLSDEQSIAAVAKAEHMLERRKKRVLVSARGDKRKREGDNGPPPKKQRGISEEAKRQRISAGFLRALPPELFEKIIIDFLDMEDIISLALASPELLELVEERVVDNKYLINQIINATLEKLDTLKEELRVTRSITEMVGDDDGTLAKLGRAFFVKYMERMESVSVPFLAKMSLWSRFGRDFAQNVLGGYYKIRIRSVEQGYPSWNPTRWLNVIRMVGKIGADANTIWRQSVVLMARNERAARDLIEYRTWSEQNIVHFVDHDIENAMREIWETDARTDGMEPWVIEFADILTVEACIGVLAKYPDTKAAKAINALPRKVLWTVKQSKPYTMSLDVAANFLNLGTPRKWPRGTLFIGWPTKVNRQNAIRNITINNTLEWYAIACFIAVEHALSGAARGDDDLLKITNELGMIVTRENPLPILWLGKVAQGAKLAFDLRSPGVDVLTRCIRRLLEEVAVGLVANNSSDQKMPTPMHLAVSRKKVLDLPLDFDWLAADTLQDWRSTLECITSRSYNTIVSEWAAGDTYTQERLTMEVFTDGVTKKMLETVQGATVDYTGSGPMEMRAMLACFALIENDMRVHVAVPGMGVTVNGFDWETVRRAVDVDDAFFKRVAKMVDAFLNAEKPEGPNAYDDYVYGKRDIVPITEGWLGMYENLKERLEKL